MTAPATRSAFSRAGSALSVAQASELIPGICFKTGPPQTLGVELELLLPQLCSPAALLTLQRHQPDLRHCQITWEPGGQLELSSAPSHDLSQLLARTQHDLDQCLRWLEQRNQQPTWHGVDPERPARRLADLPRYQAMETYFDRREAPSVLPPVGRGMMCSTASLQVNVDQGLDPDARWQFLHDLAPVLIATFANSPRWGGLVTGWKSNRQIIWQHLDLARTTVPTRQDGELRRRYTDFALDAPLMMIQPRYPDTAWSCDPGLTLREWLLAPERGPRAPDADDVRYHLSTLFPPVRAKGWFEVRYLDLPPQRWWQVPVALLAALLGDHDEHHNQCREAADAVQGLGEDPETWQTAAREGLADERLAKVALDLFDVAIPRLRSQHPALAEQCERFATEYTRQRRCPADDYLDAEAGLKAKESA